MKDENVEEMILLSRKDWAFILGGMAACCVAWLSVAAGVVVLIWKAVGNE